MRKKAMCLRWVVLVCLLLTATLAFGLSLEGDTWFKLSVSGPISVKTGTPTPFNFKINNQTESPKDVANLQIVVIEPMTGKRVAGPSTISVTPATIPSDASRTVTANISIPQAYVNRTLAMVISAVDANSVVRGTTGWAFVTAK